MTYNKVVAPKHIHMIVSVIGKRKILIELDEDAPSEEAIVNIEFSKGTDGSTLADFFGILQDSNIVRPSMRDDLDLGADLRDLAS